MVVIAVVVVLVVVAAAFVVGVWGVTNLGSKTNCRMPSRKLLCKTFQAGIYC